MEKLNYLGKYEDLVSAFLDCGYKTKYFHSTIEAKQDLILRHDVDFSCDYALETAIIENKLNVAATYFFLLSSDSYNLLSQKNINTVLRIKQYGHEISLHFDPVTYGDDFLEGFKYERDIFEKTFKTKIQIISIHRPNDFFLNYDEKLDNVEHTYQKKYFKDIKYFSDSQGKFRFGHPLKSDDFQEKKTIHLLTHPIWWHNCGDSNIEVLLNHIDKQQLFLNHHISQNCIVFKEYQDNK